MVIRLCILVVLMVVITGADCDVTGGSESWLPGTCYLVYLWFRLGFKGLHPKLGGEVMVGGVFARIFFCFLGLQSLFLLWLQLQVP